MAEERTPAVSKELLAFLDRVFPDRCPTLDMSDRQIWMAAGASNVVRCLRKAYEEQSNRVLENRK